MRKSRSLVALAMVLVLSLVCLTGCGGGSDVESAGTLTLKVNPEIDVLYDEAGLVTGLKAQNKDAEAILEGYTGYNGKEVRAVVNELVDLIGEAGYFVEEVEGEAREITIEIEKGSKLPYDTFMDEIVKDVKTMVTANGWKSPLNITNGTDYGYTDYVDTDYGPDNDGDTDYTDYGPGNDGVTDYTDYGTGNQGTPVGTNATDYDDTDYGPNNDGVTDYDDTDYGPNNDGVTDYDDTDYGPNNDGVTDYDDGKTDYDDPNSNYGDSAYDN